MTSVPKTDQNGKANGRQRVEKWFIELEIEPAWIRRMLQGLRRLADPMQRFMIPASVAPEGEIVTEIETPIGYEPPVWEPRYDDEPEETEEGSWEPAEEEAPAPPVPLEPPKTNGKTNGPRPSLAPDKLREILKKKVENSTLKDPETGEYVPVSYHPFGAKTAQIVASRFQAAFNPDEGLPESQEAMYKTCLIWLTGHLSAKDLTAAWADAILDWLVNGNKADKFKAAIVPPAPAEAMAIYKQALTEADEDKRRAEADQEEADFIAEGEMLELWAEAELPELKEDAFASYPD